MISPERKFTGNQTLKSKMRLSSVCSWQCRSQNACNRIPLMKDKVTEIKHVTLLNWYSADNIFNNFDIVSQTPTLLFNEWEPCLVARVSFIYACIQRISSLNILSQTTKVVCLIYFVPKLISWERWTINCFLKVIVYKED